MNKAIFLDRDGTLIEDAGYPKEPGQVHIIKDAIPALQKLRNAEFLLVVISNQSGIGRGMITPEEAKSVHDRFIDLYQQAGIEFSGVYYCPHSPDEPCECRKPLPGMILQAARELAIDVKPSYMIGDKLSDVQSGIAAETKSILYRGHPSNAGKDITPDFKSDDWQSIVDFILSSIHGENET